MKSWIRVLLLLAVVLVQVGCATTRASSDDAASDLQPVPSHDDSHGWGANLQGGSN